MRPMLPAEVADIRASYAAGEGVRSIARRLRRSPSHVAQVADGRLHAEPEAPVAPPAWEYTRVDEPVIGSWLADGWEPFAALAEEWTDRDGDRHRQVEVCLRRLRTPGDGPEGERWPAS